jgi:carboxymethylenebutenolidase
MRRIEMTIVRCHGAWLLAPLLLCGVLAAAGTDGNQDKDYTARMAAEHADDSPVASPAADKPASAVETERVTYATVGDRPVTGYLARPKAAKGRPGIIVIHEWWGLNDNIESMARQLAAEGYVALAVDLYGGEVAETPDKARELMSKAMGDTDPIDDNLRQAYAYLTDKQGAGKVGSIGWCFGGGMSLHAAILLPDALDATVIYYGRLSTDREALARLSMPVLGLFGEADRGIPVDQVNEFGATMKELGKDARIHIYDGANHAFANPSGTRYDAKAAEDAWQKTLEFLEENLAG